MTDLVPCPLAPTCPMASKRSDCGWGGRSGHIISYVKIGVDQETGETTHTSITVPFWYTCLRVREKYAEDPSLFVDVPELSEFLGF